MTEWKTSLFPKGGLYLVPIRMSVQKSEELKVGDRWLSDSKLVEDRRSPRRAHRG